MKSDSAAIKKRYDRIAPYFEGLEAVMEGLFFKNWRKKLWAKVDGHHILEVGVGTGKNFDYYPADARITAIDFSQEMLKQATHKKARKNISVELNLMDAQSYPLPTTVLIPLSVLLFFVRADACERFKRAIPCL